MPSAVLTRAVVDAPLRSLGYRRYVLPDDTPHTLTDAWGAALPYTLRTAVLFFETNGVRLRCDGGVPDNTTNGTPRAAGLDYTYTLSDMTRIRFCNATAGAAAIVHMELFA